MYNLIISVDVLMTQ